MEVLMTGVDCDRVITANTAAQIKAAGHGMIGRYINRSTTAEAQNILGAGLDVLYFYETTANRAQIASNGTYDGQKGLACAKAIGMPTSAGICYTVDSEPTVAQFPTIAEYFKAVRAQIGDYKLGAYGNAKLMDYLSNLGICDFYVQCAAWSYGKVSNSTTIYQCGYGKTVCGVPVDIDEVYSTAGLWLNEAESENDMTPDDVNKLIAAALAKALPTYATIDDVPVSLQAETKVLMSVGAINGGTDAAVNPNDVNLTQDALKAAIIGKRYVDSKVK